MPSLNTKLASAPNTQTNYVLKATSSTTIGNSIISDDGTTASVAGKLNFGTTGQMGLFGSSSTTDKYISLNNSAGTFDIGTNSTGNYLQANNTNALKLIVNTSTIALSIASTGIATFTSTITPLIIRGTNVATMWTEYYYNTSTLSGYIGSGDGLLSGANASDFIVRSQADFVVATGGNNRRLTIASTGAATFSSSVNLGSIANSGDTSLLNIKQSSTAYNNGIYLERGGERNGYFMYIGGALDALTFRRNYFGTQSDVMSLTRDGNVGIGTNSPTRLLDARGTVNLSTTTPTVGSTSGAYADVHLRTFSGYPSAQAKIVVVDYWMDFYSTYTDGFRWFNWDSAGTTPVERMRITSGGNVGIGTTSPAERLHIYGGGSGPEIRLEGSYGSWYIRAYNDNFNIYSPIGRQNISCLNNGDVRNYNNTTTWQTTSDFRVKENINTISNALNTVLLLNPVTFDYKEEFAQKNNWDNNKKIDNAGFIAQEFETIFPKYVSTSEYSIGETIIDDFKSIDTGHLVAYLVKAVQELNQKVEAQQEQINQLINK